ATLAKTIAEIINFMLSKNINLPLFLAALTWGTPECTQDRTIMRARSVLMNSLELSQILEKWHKPPRPPGSTNPRPTGAKPAIERVAKLCVVDIVKRELANLSEIVWNDSRKMTEQDITSLHIKQITSEMKAAAPMLWELFDTMARSSKQMKRNKRKDPDRIITIVLSMLLYSRNQHCNKLQKVFGIYFKCRQLSIRGFDVLHQLGITMSSTWAQNTLNGIAQDNMDTLVQYMDKLLVVLTYDNVNIKRVVYEQRADHQTTFDNGAAATGFVKQSCGPLTPDQITRIKAARAEGIFKPIDCQFIYELEETANRTLHPHIRFRILQALLDSPEFNFKAYQYRTSPLFDPPNAVRPLRPDDTAIQFLFRTVKMEETSYEGNDNVVKEILRQLKLDSIESREKLGREKMIPIVGDQLTVDRLRNLYKFRAEDNSSYERMEHILDTFGWFHLEMIDAVSLHRQYSGSAATRGLLHDFTLLNKKGISRTITKGPFFHHLDEAIHHRLEAHLRYAWIITAGVKKLSDLRERTPEQLLALAERVYLEHASTLALDKMALSGNCDDIRHQAVMWNRDGLHYVTLRKAVKEGDVGIMEAMLPRLLFRFIGGKNKRYTGEILELIQALHRELPSDVCDIVREHFWLINFQGQRDTFLPHDLGQEHNIKGIKVRQGIAGGPYGDWEFLYKYSPATRTMLQANKHVEGEFGADKRGTKHSPPDKEGDIKKLMQSYEASKIYDYQG
ncbi:hypothetical protein SCHPADRAFT_805408, partial [Schizopora paradoxa]